MHRVISPFIALIKITNEVSQQNDSSIIVKASDVGENTQRRLTG